MIPQALDLPSKPVKNHLHRDPVYTAKKVFLVGLEELPPQTE